ncbi:outer membrane beta-barrel protein [Salmonirosea aquatica]|uniref:Outer membrane beta-barrel protein n=1 Tax=Salmonirosea aquatica TaxID=2654236 RepID=A0A7C9FPS1_9BACT|nr:outer membrane beta-barrel protein [Cytophagaceae bacterium SJW1-29]
MKKISLFFLTAFLMFSINLFAQQGGDSNQIDGSTRIPTYKTLKKGALTFSLNGSANNSRQIAGWSLTPQAGYLVADRLVVGLQMSVANRFSKQEYNSWVSLKRGAVREYAFTPEVYARYHVLPFRLSPFLQLSSGYNIGEFTINDGLSRDKISLSTNNYVMFGALGLSLRIGEKMALQTQYNLPLIVDSKRNDMIGGNRFRLGLSLYLR